MSDHSDDMEFYSGMIEDEDFDDIDNLIIKQDAVLRYCEKHLDKMWAAKIVGILLDCDFRITKQRLKEYYDWAEEKGLGDD